MKAPGYCKEFVPDPAIPADHRGRSTCGNCHRVGEPGDAGHTPPPPPAAPKSRISPALIAAAQAREAAMLGEHDDREEYR